ncbi:MAG: hypothetical protein GY877_13075, partial [Hyphomicrobium sp.]|nr:hypothetical protein [Hyphomicrobium sp.]
LKARLATIEQTCSAPAVARRYPVSLTADLDGNGVEDVDRCSFASDDPPGDDQPFRACLGDDRPMNWVLSTSRCEEKFVPSLARHYSLALEHEQESWSLYEAYCRRDHQDHFAVECGDLRGATAHFRDTYARLKVMWEGFRAHACVDLSRGEYCEVTFDPGLDAEHRRYAQLLAELRCRLIVRRKEVTQGRGA